jgi:hypothetical protein
VVKKKKEATKGEFKKNASKCRIDKQPTKAREKSNASVEKV